MLPITKTGYNNLKEKLKKLKVEYEKMPSIIGNARARGDLKENAEYHAAREKQGMLKAQIDKINGDIASARIIDPATLPESVINFGKTVTIKEKESGRKYTYKIVGPAESDIDNGLLSITTALAKGLLGKKQGETTAIKVPAGTKNYTVTDIQYKS